ncbi:uncharacterized protein [Manis javanica]|uniref:uncharacterized protein n=1 Tax=Manis javanica TaxID=9974 RepID=UPI003C6D241F
MLVAVVMVAMLMVAMLVVTLVALLGLPRVGSHASVGWLGCRGFSSSDCAGAQTCVAAAGAVERPGERPPCRSPVPAAGSSPAQLCSVPSRTQHLHALRCSCSSSLTGSSSRAPGTRPNAPGSFQRSRAPTPPCSACRSPAHSGGPPALHPGAPGREHLPTSLDPHGRGRRLQRLSDRGRLWRHGCVDALPRELLPPRPSRPLSQSPQTPSLLCRKNFRFRQVAGNLSEHAGFPRS